MGNDNGKAPGSLHCQLGIRNYHGDEERRGEGEGNEARLPISRRGVPGEAGFGTG
jgi:hypothetical protein